MFKNEEKLIDDHTIVTLTIMIAESNPEEKEMMISVVILLFKNKNDAVVEMTLPEDNNQIFASKYLTVLPSKEELKKLIEREE